MTLETILTEIAEAGYLVNNLFQHDNGSWQANLRSTSGHTAFAYGATAYEALALTLNLLEEVESFTQTERVEYSINIKPVDIIGDLSTIMSNLLPKKQINRRL